MALKCVKIQENMFRSKIQYEKGVYFKQIIWVRIGQKETHLTYYMHACI